MNTFIELKTNHRFCEDEQWGNLMTNLRNNGPSEELVQFVNTTFVKIWDVVVPNDIPYVTYDNIDRASINCGIFSEHIKATHSQDINDSRLPVNVSHNCDQSIKA